MPKPTVLILTEAGPGVGLGHITRCAHLAAALRNAGADVWAVPDRPTAATGFLRSRDVFTDSPLTADVGIVDLMHWDEAAVGNLADRTSRLVAIVGAGQPAIVSGLVDLVVYQTGWPSPSVTVVGGSNQRALFGPDYLILGPDYAHRQENHIRDGVLVCFGEGIPDDYVHSVTRGLYDKGLGGTLVLPPYIRLFEVDGFSAIECPDGLAVLQRLHSVQVGSIGMSTYEALAAGCLPITVGRTEDHAETGRRLTELGMGLCLGCYQDVQPEMLADATLKWSGFSWGFHRIDGLGAERVARKILEMMP